MQSKIYMCANWVPLELRSLQCTMLPNVLAWLCNAIYTTWICLCALGMVMMAHHWLRWNPGRFFFRATWLGAELFGHSLNLICVFCFGVNQIKSQVPTMILRPKHCWMKDFLMSLWTWASWVTIGPICFKSTPIIQQLWTQWDRSQSCCMATCQHLQSNFIKCKFSKFTYAPKMHYYISNFWGNVPALIQVMRAKRLVATTCASTGNLNWRHGLQTLHRAVFWSQPFLAPTTSMMVRSI